MTSFWIVSVALAILAFLFIALPAYKFKSIATKSDSGEDDERKRQNVAIFKERLAELHKEFESGKLTTEEFEELKSELELALLADVELNSHEDENHHENNASNALLWSALFSVLVIGASYIFYFQYGSYDRVLQKQAMQFNSEDMKRAESAVEQGDMASLLQQLYDKLQGSPDNIEGWMLFARTAMNMELFDKAAEGYSKVIASIEANGGDASGVYGMLAQAYYFSPGGVGPNGAMSPVVKTTLDKALSLNQNESNSLGLYAIHAFETGDYAGAIQYWERMLQAVPDHPARASIETGIQRARELSGKEPRQSQPAVNNAVLEGAVEDSQENKTGVAGVTVTVALDDAVLSQVSPDDFVFVFARSENGPPMPLAASRHKVSELPLTIHLDDTKAMAPMAKLSNVERANIVARVSKSGQPVAQKGDVEGRIQDVSVMDQEKVSIVIDTLIE